MLNSTVLEIATSLIFIYFLLSLVVSAIQEWIAQGLSLRSQNLAQGIKNLLSDPNGAAVVKLYNHPLIAGITAPSRKTVDKATGKSDVTPHNGPPYIPAEIFAKALLDNLGFLLPADPNKAAAERDKAAKNALSAAPEGLKNALQPLIVQANGDIAALQKSVEDWYDAAMDRVTGWYRRRSQWIALLIGLGVAAAFNADTLHIVHVLSQDPAARAAIIKEAEKAATNAAATPPKAATNAAAAPHTSLETLQGVTLPFGWTTDELSNPFATAAKGGAVFGWLITGLALGMGAPFWFDLLKTFVNLRATGARPAKAADNRKKVTT